MHISSYIHPCMHACTYTHTCIHTYIQAGMHTYIHGYIDGCIHTYVHTYMHTQHMCVCMFIYISTCKYSIFIYIFTHTTIHVNVTNHRKWVHVCQLVGVVCAPCLMVTHLDPTCLNLIVWSLQLCRSIPVVSWISIPMHYIIRITINPSVMYIFVYIYSQNRGKTCINPILISIVLYKLN